MDELEAKLSELLVATSDYGDEELPKELSGVLRVLRQQLNMDVVFVSKIAEGRRTFVAVDAAPGQEVIQPGMSDPVEQSWCHNIVQGRLPELIMDSKPFIESGRAPSTPFEIGTHLSVPVVLPNGAVYGTLCTFAFHVEKKVSEEDVWRLRRFARLISDLLRPA